MIRLEPFNTIGKEEIEAAERVLRNGPLSGFLGGDHRGGYFVTKLETEWSEAFQVRHAIACNSATSGLLAACVACGVTTGTPVTVPAYTMSATAAAPLHLGAVLHFADIQPDTFCLGDALYDTTVIATNLFGHPAELKRIKNKVEFNSCYLIEDNAQGPFAMEGGKYAGTIGHIGVFSLNVHKHIQSGEGGIVCTNDDGLAEAVRDFINHGELGGSETPGLNLRMCEVTAAIASAQLKKAPGIIADRIEQAEFLSDCVKDIPFIKAPTMRGGCKHVYYCWCPLATSYRGAVHIAEELTEYGFPLRQGYVRPLHNLAAFNRFYRGKLPTTDDVEDRIIVFENCAFTIPKNQRPLVRKAFERVFETREKFGLERSEQ